MDSTFLRKKLHQQIDQLPEQVLKEVYSLTSQYSELTWDEIISQQLSESNDPEELAMWREESAFQAQLGELHTKHAGEFIAMRNGSVIDSDKSQIDLYRRVKQIHPNQFVLIAKVDESIAPIYHFRSPRLV